MIRECLAFGNNVCGNLDPTNQSPILKQPANVTEAIKCDEIIWHGWSCTFGRGERFDVSGLNIPDNQSGGFWAWGVDPLISDPGRINEIHFLKPVKRVLGFDRPLGCLAEDGQVHSFEGAISSERWDDVALTGLGGAYAFRSEL